MTHMVNTIPANDEIFQQSLLSYHAIVLKVYLSALSFEQNKNILVDLKKKTSDSLVSGKFKTALWQGKC